MQPNQESNLRPSHYYRDALSGELPDTHFRIIRVRLSSHSACSKLERCERPSNDGKVSGSISDSGAFSHCWFKKLFSLYYSFSVKKKTCFHHILRP